MCGIFGVLLNQPGRLNSKITTTLLTAARKRGRDSGGVVFGAVDRLQIYRADYDVNSLMKKVIIDNDYTLFFGHSRLITNGMDENQPVFADGVLVVHNGIVCNLESAWKSINETPSMQIDTEIIAKLARIYFNENRTLEGLDAFIFERCEGVVSALVYVVDAGCAALISNNGSLYRGRLGGDFIFSSEESPLLELGVFDIEQVLGCVTFDVAAYDNEKVFQQSYSINRLNLVPLVDPKYISNNVSSQGNYLSKNIRRCCKCILPETMPFIDFDSNGLCNYCRNYRPQSKPKGADSLLRKLSTLSAGEKFLMPFSGGRDSSYALHLVVKELGLRPITYTYDWGMVTDLGRRNISRMCGILGVENIVVADDIGRNREDVRKNLSAWLKYPDLGMLNILTAAEKHFFRFNSEVCERLGVNYNIWGTCPFETTHFKSGFLGIPPAFANHSVYRSGLLSQLNYQSKRFAAMTHSLGYFNTSIFRNLLGEYYRSIGKKSGYIHIFDYFPWVEDDVNSALKEYNWEMSCDTTTTWRIGDASAAFYNYVYYHMAGFSEHDTFRSNQIREGHITREKAMLLVDVENQPRIPNIKWYLDVLGLPFDDVMKRVNGLRPIFDIGV